MRWIKSSALFLAASLTLGAGLTALTADPAAGTTGQATLHKGSDKITLTWVARKNGAAFLGTIGNLSIEGSSVQPDPDVGTFDVSGKLEGKTNLHLTLSLASAKPTALAFREWKHRQRQTQGSGRDCLPRFGDGKRVFDSPGHARRKSSLRDHFAAC